MNRFQKSLLVFGLITLGAVGKLGLDFCLGYSLKPLDWSPDGRWIAAQLEYGGFRDGYALALVSAKTGRLERILYNNQDGGSGFPSAAFSPDSRFVTYHFLGDYVVDLQGNILMRSVQERRLPDLAYTMKASRLRWQLVRVGPENVVYLRGTATKHSHFNLLPRQRLSDHEAVRDL